MTFAMYYVNGIACINLLFFLVVYCWGEEPSIRTCIIPLAVIAGLVFMYANFRMFLRKFLGEDVCAGSGYAMRYFAYNGFFSFMSAFSMAILFSLLSEKDMDGFDCIAAGAVSLYFILNAVFTKRLWA